MEARARQVMFWIPRVLGILLAIFVSLFALDVFSEGYSLGEAILALLIHLIPTYLLVAALLVAWRWERIGAIIYFALAAWLLYMSGGRAWPISVLVFLVGSLFLLGWRFRIKAGGDRPPSRQDS